jgi:hypothetical protein
VDELELLKTMRTDERPTTDERSRAADDLMAFIEHGEVTPTIELAPAESPKRQPSRTRSYAARFSVAAVVVLVALVAWSAGEGGGPFKANPSGAEALRAAATTGESAPYPPTPYSVTVRTETATADGSLEIPDNIDVGPVDTTTWHIDETDTISTVPVCETPHCATVVSFSIHSINLAPDATAAEAREAIQRRVDDALASPANQTSRAALTLSAVSEALANPSLGAVARAELLRMIAATADVSTREGVANAFGLTGTRFTAVAGDSSIVVVIDPTDGYLLQQQSVRVALPAPNGTTGPHLQIASRISYDRPQPAAPLPAEVSALAARVREQAPDLDPTSPLLGCVIGVPGTTGGITVPNGLVFTHCPES